MIIHKKDVKIVDIPTSNFKIKNLVGFDSRYENDKIYE